MRVLSSEFVVLNKGRMSLLSKFADFLNSKLKTQNLKLSSDRGVALMMVLWVLVLLSILSMNFLRSTRWVMGSTHNLKEETLTYYQALSGYHEALHYIALDKDPQVDFLDEEGNFWIDIETNPVTGIRETEDGVLEIRITDENARININFAQPDRLRKLLERVGIKEDEIIVIMDSVMDWKDLDKEHHLSGAEDDYYESLKEPYKTKNGLFDVTEELALVRGMKPEYLYGDGTDTSSGLHSIITTFGKNTLNINTVSHEVMEFLGLNGVEIEMIMKQRNKAYGGFRFIPPLSVSGLNAMSTQTFRIEVTARMKNSPIVSRITGIVSREHSAKGNELRTIYWRERAETFRA